MKKPNDIKRPNGYGLSKGQFYRLRGAIKAQTKQMAADVEKHELKMAKLGPDSAKAVAVAVTGALQRSQYMGGTVSVEERRDER